jgi:hypothetical protein
MTTPQLEETMKSLKLTFAVLGLSLAALLPLQAASSLSVNVPYPFVAGNVRLPAGSYTIQESMTNGVITIRNNQGKTVALLSGPGVGTPNGAPSLTFVNVRGQMVLMSVHEAEHVSRVLPTGGIVQ